jgi:hypothetical protein
MGYRDRLDGIGGSFLFFPLRDLDSLRGGCSFATQRWFTSFRSCFLEQALEGVQLSSHFSLSFLACFQG